MPNSVPRSDADRPPENHSVPRSAAPAPARRPSGDRTAATLDAEVGRLIHELRPFRVMRGGELARRAGAGYWGAGGFDAAVRTGERRGDLRRLPFGYVELARRSRPR
jgi:hypothetical protein